MKNTLRNISLAADFTSMPKLAARAAADFHGKPSWHGLKPASYATRLTLGQRIANAMLGRKVY